MAPRRILAWALCGTLPVTPAWAQSHHGSGHGGHHKCIPVAVGGVPFYPYPPYYMVGGVVPTMLVPPGVGTGFGLPAPLPPPQFDSGKLLAGPLPPKRLTGLTAARPAPRPKRGDPEKAQQYLTYGDRLFRAGNIKRAAERFDQAASNDPHTAAPRVRLAQVALVRGQFAEAARHLREAQKAEPGWLVTATDIQAIYGEPSDFSKQIAKLESHLQANPNDRDAWLVLGAELFLSGRTQKAADIFMRLTDRKPDATLAAFLDATTPRQEESRQ